MDVRKALQSALVLGTFSRGKGHFGDGTATSSRDPDGLFRQESCCLNYMQGFLGVLREASFLRKTLPKPFGISTTL